MIFRVLIVDDEPHVVESISALLENSDMYDLELHAAYRAQQALDIMRQGRIDLLLTDIQMPGMDGLSLIREVHHLWPECTTVILTAYPEFQYARQAIEHRVAGYILKTEEEAEILSKLHGVLGQIEEALNHREWTMPLREPDMADEVRQTLLARLIYAQMNEQETREILTQMDFGQGRMAPLMVLARPNEAINRMLLDNALARYLGDKLRRLVCAPLDKHCFMLLMELDAGTDFLASTLETVQASIHTTGMQELAFLLGGSWTPDTPFQQPFQRLRKAAARLEDQFEMCILDVEKTSSPGHVTVDFLKNYISAHINEDLTLMQLSEITGYNASYLSRIFSAETNETLVKYIARKRMEAIRQLMLDPSLSLEQIMTMTHFNSRSYFNSFVKKETGLSPKKYRAQVGVQG